MQPLTIFLREVIVLSSMLIGMFIAESVTSSLFGHVQERLKQLIYLLLFVVFLVLGNHVPALMGLPYMGFLNSVLLSALWGFLSVFLSRTLLYLMGASINLFRRLRPRKKQKTMVDTGRLIAHLQKRGVGDEQIDSILSSSLGSQRKAASIQQKAKKGRLKKRTPIDPYRLSAAVHRRGFTAREITDLLVRFLQLTPEQAANIWKKSTSRK